jgi:hypothetical protein
MATVSRFPIDHLPDEELAIQLWELDMAGECGSDAFMRIDAEICRRNSPQYALRLQTVTPSAPAPRLPVSPMPFTTAPLTRVN